MKNGGFKDCHFGQLGTINAQYIARENLFRLRNRSKLFEGNLIATKLLVSGQSPEFSDCLLRSMDQQEHEKFKRNKTARIRAKP